MVAGSPDVSDAIFEIRDLLRLLAEPAIAERDQKRREQLRKIVGASVPKAKAVLLMDGTRNQQIIHKETGVNQGHLSTLIKQLSQAGLVTNTKQPRIEIRVPENFFEKG